MGVYDYVKCEYSLPEGAPSEGYQTKDTPAQFLDLYVITPDGRLLHERCDREWVDVPGRPIFGGYLKEVSREMVEVPFRGEVSFGNGDWEFSGLFDDGRLLNLRVVRAPTPEQP